MEHAWIQVALPERNTHATAMVQGPALLGKLGGRAPRERKSVIRKIHIGQIDDAIVASNVPLAAFGVCGAAHTCMQKALFRKDDENADKPKPPRATETAEAAAVLALLTA